VALLAPDIVEAILAGKTIRRRCWSNWSSRCRVLGVGSASDGG
jgi:hypothetical protein